MAMPQRDYTIEAIKRLDALLEHAVMHGAKPSRTSSHRADEIGGGRKCSAARLGLRNVDCVELTRWARRGV